MRRTDRIAHCLGIALGLTAFGVVTAADDPKSAACLVNSIDSLSPLGSSIVASPAALPLKLLRAGQGPSGSIDPVCAGDRLTSLGLRLIPGQTLSLTLLTWPGVSVPLQVTELEVATDIGQTGTWEVSLRPLEPAADLHSAQLIELLVTAGENNQRGQQRSFRLFGSENSKAGQQGLSLELNLESLDSERMFRDNFKVDPSVGQFSQRTQRPDTVDDRPAQGAASATL
ncbi:MAG: hypothetical protein V2J42_07155 [Wenzhouxiangella sp.]|jgi:hypothetical protein|nr:hypothetical protein [Wenzhouxiangella sp.]